MTPRSGVQEPDQRDHYPLFVSAGVEACIALGEHVLMLVSSDLVPHVPFLDHPIAISPETPPDRRFRR